MKFTSILIVALWLFADPFWSGPAREWTDEELNQMVTGSPWAQMMQGPPGGFPSAQVFIATAGPIQQAEAEAKRRAERDQQPGTEPPFDPFAEEYRLWLEDFGDSQVILAIRIANPEAYFENDELDQFEEETTMRLGGRKVEMTGYFPPSSIDPFVRIAFPKDLSRIDLSDLKDEKLKFELYVPGISGPFRGVEFPLEVMVVDGKLEL